MVDNPVVTAILVSYNTEDLILEAVDKLRTAAARIPLRIVIVDNASRDNSVALIRNRLADCQLIVNERNVGFGRANNQAVPLATSPYVLLLNTDAFVAPDTLDKTVAYMDGHPECGILGVKLIGRDGGLQPSARYFPTPWNVFLRHTGLDRLFPKVRMVDDLSWDHASVRSCDWVPGCYYLVRREVIDQVGLFDPRFFLYFEEVDHCFAAKRAGWQVHFFPDTTVVHIGGESAKSDGDITTAGRQLSALQVESELLYFRKNLGFAAALTGALLTTLADCLTAGKRVVKGRPAHALSYLKHTLLVWSLFFRTRLGTRPTR